MKIEIYNHASIKITASKTIYFDLYKFQRRTNDASYIFITHDHYDHYDEESIRNVMNENTILIVPKCLEERAKQLTSNIIIVEPNQIYTLNNIEFETIAAYNHNKNFHLKENNYVGYNITLDGTKYYVMGDTDRTEEVNNVSTDICFVPIGGIYTMDLDEAIAYINDLKPQKAIPIHYGSIVGDISLGEAFKNKINKEIEVEVLIK